MSDATFLPADVTTFARLDELGLEVTGQLLAPERAVLECRVLDPDHWCRRCGWQGRARDSVTRRLAHEPLGGAGPSCCCGSASTDAPGAGMCGDRTPARARRRSVRRWHAALPHDRPTLRAHSYGLLRAILQTALHDGEITANPAHIRGAGNAKRVHNIQPLTLSELQTLVQEMPERYRAMTLLAAWCALRFGELTELRRRDVDLRTGVINVRRAVTRVDGAYLIGTPKSEAGVRDVAVPPHLLPAIKQHLRTTAPGADTLLFPAAGDPTRHLAPASLYKVFYRAREAAGRPDLRWHDLRHTGAVLAVIRRVASNATAGSIRRIA